MELDEEELKATREMKEKTAKEISTKIIVESEGRRIYISADKERSYALHRILHNIQLGKSFDLKYVCNKKTEQVGWKEIELEREEHFEFKED